MLVLRRKTSTALIIAKEITVRILSIEGSIVKIGIDAPAAVPIVREELLEAPLRPAVPAPVRRHRT